MVGGSRQGPERVFHAKMRRELKACKTQTHTGMVDSLFLPMYMRGGGDGPDDVSVLLTLSVYS